MIRIALVSCLLFAGCKKKDEAKPAEPAAEKNVDDKAAEPAKPGDTAKAAEPAKPAPGAVTIASTAEYEAKSNEMLDQVLAAYAAAGTDCDKLAASIDKFADNNTPTMEAIKAYDAAHPDAEKAYAEKMKPREKELAEKLGPAFEACKDHQGLSAALKKAHLN